MMNVISTKRIQICLAVFVLGFGLLLIRLAYLQFFQPKGLSQRAIEQSRLIQELSPFRGKILDRNGEEFALDLRTYSLGVNARAIQNKSQMVLRLHQILDIDQGFIRERLNRDKSFVWLARKLTREETDEIKVLNNRHLELRPEWKRIYPNGDKASQVIGFTGIDHEGLEGVEYKFDDYLKGVPGWKTTLKDAKQREVVSKQTDLVLPVDGYHLRLSLDSVIQHSADQLLRLTCEKYKALGGVLLVMNAKNGDVLAMANYPSYDLNEASSSNPNMRRNRSITDIYEPGSIFKIATLASVLEEKLHTLDNKIFCENGAYRTGGRILHDVHPYGYLSLTDVIVKSSNIGTSKISSRLGKQKLYDYIRKFGFYDKTQIDLPGEVRGLFRPPNQWSATSISSISIGQEIGVTGIQLIQFMSAIANDGMMMKPRIVLGVENDNGESIKQYPESMTRRIVSKKIAQDVKEVLVQVVERGTGRRARIEGFRIGGKTGTAQKLEPDGSYSHEHFISSFMGFVEFEGNVLTILVSIDDPSPQYYGGTVAAPLFKKMVTQILEYW